ncbi:MAG: FecR domain-containing protein [Kiritimatiellae bacterium]|nr:FecR domain-containing protein [Kiritimatiellia bacterium]
MHAEGNGPNIAPVAQLSLNLADGCMTDEEFARLETLLATEEGAVGLHHSLLELEAHLRGSRGNLDVTEAVMDRIHGLVDQRVERQVMQRIRSRPRPTGATRARGGGRYRTAGGGWAARVTGMAAAVLMAVGALVAAFLGRVPVLPGHPAAARLGRVAGDVRLVAGGRERVAGGAEELGLDTEVRVGAGGARAEIVYGDGSTLSLGERAEVVIAPGAARRIPAAGRTILIMNGLVDADVRHAAGAGSSMAVFTPQAEIHVVGTRFGVRVGRDSTRIDLREGKVRVSNRRDGESVLLAEGRSAVVGRTLAVVETQAIQGAGPAPEARVTEGLQVLYGFGEGGGAVIRDISGVEPPVDLRLSGRGYRWLPGGGLAFPVEGHSIMAQAQRPAKLFAPFLAAGELTVEVWLRTGSLYQRDGRRILVFDDPAGAAKNTHNWAVAQAHADEWGPGNIDFRVRIAGGSTGQFVTSGSPLRRTDAVYHLVCVFAPRAGASVYVDGERCACRPTPGRLKSEGKRAWDPGYTFGLGNRTTSLDRGWQGAVYLVAVYSRALSPEEVQRNYRAHVWLEE